MLHSALVISYIIMATIFFGVMAIALSLLDKSGYASHKVAGIWGASILSIARVHVKVMGLKNIDPEKPYIYMANHQSNFDIPVLLGNLPVQFRWLAKEELFRIPLFGLAMKRVGYISIDRSDFRKAVQSLKKAAETIRNGASVIIFPEGTRSRDGYIQDFKKGGFVMAIDSKVPIVPVVIHGTRAIMAKESLHIKANDVLIEIKQPIQTTDYTRKTKEKLMSRVRQSICQSFDRGAADTRC